MKAVAGHSMQSVPFNRIKSFTFKLLWI